MLDLTRERSVSVSDRVWELFSLQARRLGMNTSQAMEAALRQWVTCEPREGTCLHCGQVLCETDHHMQWCEEGDGRARGASHPAARPFLAPPEVQQRG